MQIPCLSESANNKLVFEDNESYVVAFKINFTDITRQGLSVMDKRNRYKNIKYIVPLIATFLVGQGSAIILSENFSTEESIGLADRLQGYLSVASGYTHKQNPETDFTFQIVHFINKQHVLALVKKGVTLSYIRCDFPDNPMVIKIIKEDCIQQIGSDYDLKIYGLEKPIEKAVPFKLFDAPQEVLKELYVLTKSRVGEEEEIAEFVHALKAAYGGEGIGNTRSMIYIENAPHSSDQGFLLSSREDNGCALVAPYEGSPYLVGIGLYSEENYKGHRSAFFNLGDSIERIREVLSSTGCASSSSHQHKGTPREDRATVRNTRRAEQISQELKLSNIFDDIPHVQAGDFITIASNGIWFFNCPSSENPCSTMCLGLVPTLSLDEKPIFMQVKEVKQSEGGLIGITDNEGNYIEIVPNGSISITPAEGSKLTFYVNGWVCDNGKWLYQGAGHKSLLKKRDFTLENGVRVTVFTDDKIRTEWPSGKTTVREQKLLTSWYPHGARKNRWFRTDRTVITYPNGLVFTYLPNAPDPQITLLPVTVQPPAVNEYTYHSGLKEILDFSSDNILEQIYPHGRVIYNPNDEIVQVFCEDGSEIVTNITEFKLSSFNLWEHGHGKGMASPSSTRLSDTSEIITNGLDQLGEASSSSTSLNGQLFPQPAMTPRSPKSLDVTMPREETAQGTPQTHPTSNFTNGSLSGGSGEVDVLLMEEGDTAKGVSPERADLERQRGTPPKKRKRLIEGTVTEQVSSPNRPELPNQASSSKPYSQKKQRVSEEDGSKNKGTRFPKNHGRVDEVTLLHGVRKTTHGGTTTLIYPTGLQLTHKEGDRCFNVVISTNSAYSARENEMYTYLDGTTETICKDGNIELAYQNGDQLSIHLDGRVKFYHAATEKMRVGYLLAKDATRAFLVPEGDIFKVEFPRDASRRHKQGGRSSRDYNPDNPRRNPRRDSSSGRDGEIYGKERRATLRPRSSGSNSRSNALEEGEMMEYKNGHDQSGEKESDH